ncbi:Respiratory burst oxidase-like protein F [Nymphaea thermarum]|nr:Respiratory burst oxidase-like protein F [Nymphaea thermarum]
MQSPASGSNLRTPSFFRSHAEIRTGTSGANAGMLTVFLNDLNTAGIRSRREDLVEVTLEIDADAEADADGRGIFVRSVGSVSEDGGGAGGRLERTGSSNSLVSRGTSSFWRLSADLMAEIRRYAKSARSPSSRFSAASRAGGEESMLAARYERRLRAELERNRPSARHALNGLRFISNTTLSVAGEVDNSWRCVESRFQTLAEDGLISREDFAECIGKLKIDGFIAGMEDSKEFALCIFDALARRRRQKIQKINKDELYDFWLQITDESFDARLQIFFDMVDSNSDGRITRDEVQELIMLSASANKLSGLKEQADEYATLIMEELDPENLGYIEVRNNFNLYEVVLWQLETLLLQRDAYMNYSHALSCTSQGWTPNKGLKPRTLARRMSCRFWCFLQENWQRAWVISLWLAIMTGLFYFKFNQYRHKSAFKIMGYCLTTAKGAAETLKFNMALILLPVCRNTLTWLRSTPARLLVPFDDNINFHKVIAFGVVIGTILHVGNHLFCDFPRLIGASPQQFSLISHDFNNHQPTYPDLLKGMEGITGLAMILLMAVAFVLASHHFRRSILQLPRPFSRLTGFNAFWYSHHLLAIVYVLLLLHGYFMYFVHKWYQKTTWMYLAVPLLLYLGERTLRALRSKSYSVKIWKVSVHPGSVLSLVMSKPPGFRYRSGQYVFLQCPAVSPFEWHPFSITSAPGDDYLSIHIRTVGDWTEELKRVFTEPFDDFSIIGRAKFNKFGEMDQACMPKLLIDGPYGAPAQDYENYDVLLLVGLGIGATPFISILRDLLNSIRHADDLTDSYTETSKSDDSSSSFKSGGSSKKKTHRTTNAHFYWVTREAGSFEWFKEVMNEVAEMDQKGVIEMHNYLTSVYEEGDARSTLLTMVQALNHAKHGVDILSGTGFYFSYAGVFYCGVPMLAKELNRLSNEMTQNTSTRFKFHKELF